MGEGIDLRDPALPTRLPDAFGTVARDRAGLGGDRRYLARHALRGRRAPPQGSRAVRHRHPRPTGLRHRASLRRRERHGDLPARSARQPGRHAPPPPSRGLHRALHAGQRRARDDRRRRSARGAVDRRPPRRRRGRLGGGGGPAHAAERLRRAVRASRRGHRLDLRAGARGFRRLRRPPRPRAGAGHRHQAGRAGDARAPLLLERPRRSAPRRAGRGPPQRHDRLRRGAGRSQLGRRPEPVHGGADGGHRHHAGAAQRE